MSPELPPGLLLLLTSGATQVAGAGNGDAQIEGVGVVYTRYLTLLLRHKMTQSAVVGRSKSQFA